VTRTFKIEPSGFPDLPAMMLATIVALKELGGSAGIDELNEQVIEMEGIPEDEQAFLMPNEKDRRLAYYLAWSRTYLKRGGALKNSARGVWTLTDKGRSLDSVDQTRAIHAAVNAEERRRKKAKGQAAKVIANGESPDNSLGEEEVSDWRTALLDTVKAMTPDAFERLSQRVLREAGFTKVEVLGKVGDGGIDGLGVLRVNLVSFQVYFQCKRYQGSVPSKDIRDFRGALQGRADKGLFITTGTFTAQASEEATRQGAIAIDLIDGDRLCDLLKQFELGVSTRTRIIEEVDVSTDWFASI